MTAILSASRTTFLGSFESTYLPLHGVDVAETSGHAASWRGDLESVLASGVSELRWSLRWHRIEPAPGVFDWSETDAIMGALHEADSDPVVDFVHHTSYPAWLRDGFRDPRFGPAYVRYVEAVARRYPWLRSYTLFNEPFATLFLCGHEALWPPYGRGIDGFVRLLRNVLPAVSRASASLTSLLPNARHIWVDTCEHHDGVPGGPSTYAVEANDRRHAVLDLVLDHEVTADRPFMGKLLHAGAHELVGRVPVHVDVLGLDYYSHSEWWYDEAGGHVPSPHPQGFAALAGQYAERYALPMLLSETNLRGFPADRVSWLRYMLEQYELALDRGVDLRGFCWFPYLDSCDWDSLLARPAGRADPVGVVSLTTDKQRLRTEFTDIWERACNGAPASSLPAYRFQSPCAEQLAGYAGQMAHWPWQEPPTGDVVSPVRIESRTHRVTTQQARRSSS